MSSNEARDSRIDSTLIDLKNYMIIRHFKVNCCDRCLFIKLKV